MPLLTTMTELKGFEEKKGNHGIKRAALWENDIDTAATCTKAAITHSFCLCNSRRGMRV
jgi:hypothetical protein